MIKSSVITVVDLVGVMSMGCAVEPEDTKADEGEALGTTSSAIWTNTSYADLQHKVEIKNQYTNKCMDVAGGGTAAGTRVNQYACHRGENQQFYLYMATFNTFQIVWKRATSMCAGFAVTANQRTLADHAGLVLVPCRDAQGNVPWNTKFRLENSTDLQHPTTSHLSFRAEMPHATSSTGACIDVPGGWTSDSLQLQAYRCHGGPNQRFIVTNW